MRRLRPAAVLFACCAVLVACGGGGRRQTATNGLVVHSATTTLGGTARAILADARAALRSLRAYRLHAELVSGRRRTVLDVTADSAARVDLSYAQGEDSFEARSLPPVAYMRGSAAFWSSQVHDPAVVARFAGRWVQVPLSMTEGIVSRLGFFEPATLARCAGENVGALSLAGRTNVDGVPAIVLHDAGNVPGGTPEDYDIAAAGPPFVLRIVGLGPTRPGGRVDVCNDGKGGGATGVMTLTGFNHAPSLRAPA